MDHVENAIATIVVQMLVRIVGIEAVTIPVDVDLEMIETKTA